jgi:hypothetical protein
MKLDGYVAISPEKLIAAADEYDSKVKEDKEFLRSEKKRLKSIISVKKFMFIFTNENEWDRCHGEYDMPKWVYMRKNHPELAKVYKVYYWNDPIDTAPIRALSNQCKDGMVLCNQDLAKFVSNNSI